MNLSRRLVLGGGLASGAMLALSPSAFAEKKMPNWHAGYATAPAKGLGPAPMRLVSGTAPAGLSGALYRNGPAQFRYGDTFASHWFDGDGMVHRIAITDGKAVHTGRFVDTNKRRKEQAANKFLAAGFGTNPDPSFSVSSPDDMNAANTSVLMSGGEMLALWEGGSAFRLDPVTLETRGPLFRPKKCSSPNRQRMLHSPLLLRPRWKNASRLSIPMQAHGMKRPFRCIRAALCCRTSSPLSLPSPR